MAGQKDAAEHKDQKRRLDAGLKVIQYVGQKDAEGQKDLKREFTLCVKNLTSRS